MVEIMALLYNWVWKNEYASRRWREGAVVNLFQEKGMKQLQRCYASEQSRNRVL